MTTNKDNETCGVKLCSHIRNVYRREHGSAAKRFCNTCGSEPDDHHRFRLSYPEDHWQEEEPTTTVPGRVCRALRQPSRFQEIERLGVSAYVTRSFWNERIQ